MKLFPVKTKVIKTGDDLVKICLESLKQQNLLLENNDVLAVASKAVSYMEGRVARLSEVKPSKKAEVMAKKHSLRPEFAELILREAERIYGGVQKAVLTLKDGVLVPNAGIDSKNAPDDCVVLWPTDARKWVLSFREEIKRKTGKRIAVLVVDSGLVPLRIGASGLALAVAGFKPIRDFRKSKDLYGKPILITRLAVADDLASAAHLLMGEATEQTPMVLIKDAPVDFDDGVYNHRDMMMEPEECIFMGTFSLGLRGPK
jgi:coenzyme F420-0:L-glutamate ligase